MSGKTEIANLPAPGNGDGLTIPSAAVLGRGDLEGASETPNPEAMRPAASAYLHALRRHWALASLVGLCGAAVLGGVAWFSANARYTATALLRVASKEQQLVFRTIDQDVRGDFDTYRATQQQLIKSRFVLTAAVRNPAIAQLPLIREQRDPIAWLDRNVSVPLAGRSEIMPVQLVGSDPQQIVAIVNAVVQAYLNEVVDVERNQRRQRLNELDRVYTDTESGVRRKRNDLKHLADQLGTGDTAALNLKQQIALQQYGYLQNELTRLKFERMRAELELQAKRRMLENPSTIDVSAVELEAYARTDPVTARMLGDLELQQLRIGHDESVVSSKSASALQRQRRDLVWFQNQSQVRKESLVKDLQTRKRAVLELEARQNATNIEVLKAQEKALEDATAQAKTQATSVGESSVDMELMRGELKQSEQTLQGIAEERDRLAVELRTEPRITLLQKAEAPDSPDRSFLATVTAGSALLGLLGPVLLIAWWDVRARRVNNSQEVSRQLGLAVFGSLPAVSAKAIPEGAAGNGRQRQGHLRLSEAIDGIVAALTRRQDPQPRQVLLISSATTGEGKTTLAAQLALSLARTGHRTALVDFDLRRPALHRLFQTSLAPGVGELLRGEACLEEAGRGVADKLVLFSAGNWTGGAIGLLAREGPAALFAALRQQFEFVIVDGSPVLPVADVRFVCRHVDAVLLCVLRDVSRAPQVLAAWNVFHQLGVDRLGAIVIGVQGEGEHPLYVEEAEATVLGAYPKT